MANKDTKENPMRAVRIEKLIINCSVGESGDKVNKAAKVLKVISQFYAGSCRWSRACHVQVQIHHQIFRSQKR